MANRKDYPEIIRITRSDYLKKMEKAAMIYKRSEELAAKGIITFDPYLYPRVEEMEEHEAAYNLRRYMDYLIGFTDPTLIDIDDDEFVKTRKYITDLFRSCVEIMDDEDMEGIKTLTPERWKRMTVEERWEVFNPMLMYYGWNEFETFLKDLGWQPYMEYAHYTKKKYEKGNKSETVIDDLQAVWEYAFD